ncbi:MAG: hypothetical protein JWO98_4527 [Frankiales bacterium]|nr:hypothetical protein [Frankiales bacterium]
MTPAVYTPLASVADMREGPFNYALTGASAPYVEATMRRASRHIETRCARRLAPFTALTQADRADGVAMDDSAPGIPLSLTGTLALSQAAAYGTTTSLVRDVWLAEFAPTYPELWTYSDVSVLVIPPFGGGGQMVADGIEGPETDTGHLRLPYGTYCPVGSTIRVTYSGGYTHGIPEDLAQAAMMQATKYFILGIAPERRAGMSTTDLDAAIDEAIAPYRRA